MRLIKIIPLEDDILVVDGVAVLYFFPHLIDPDNAHQLLWRDPDPPQKLSLERPFADIKTLDDPGKRRAYPVFQDPVVDVIDHVGGIRARVYLEPPGQGKRAEALPSPGSA